MLVDNLTVIAWHDAGGRVSDGGVSASGLWW